MCPIVQGLQILLIEDSLDAAEVIQDTIGEVLDTPFNIVSVSRLGQALEYLQETRYDIVLLDIILPDSNTLNSIAQIKELVPKVPIIVLTSINDRQMALDAVRQGAQDYLPKGQFDGELLIRSINYAIERQRIKDELQQQIERERLMGRTIQRIRQSLDLRTILETTVAEVRQFLNTDRVIVYCCSEPDTGRIAAESVHFDEHKQNENSLAAIQDFLQSVSVDAAPSANAISNSDNTADKLLQLVLNAILAVPIWQTKPDREPVLWGQLIAQNTQKERRWQPWEIEFLTQLADQVAIAIQQSELFQTVEKQANLDGLTGIANRRQFDRTLEKEWLRLSKKEKPLSIIMCDVDFFTEYNNTYGHLAGDDCLKQIARAIALASQRSSDLACRYGGEEFALILPKTDTDGALTVAYHIQQNLARLQLLHSSSTIDDYVTVSIGIATCIPTLEVPPESLIESADRALRQAKQDGRNCIVISER